MLLKAETVGLAVPVELPLLICDIQRAGPSTGMPTKTEQADLLQVMFGRNGESPVPVVAAGSPADCFSTAIEAARIAIRYRTPVILLSDGYLANGSEPWRIPDITTLPDISVPFATAEAAAGTATITDTETIADTATVATSASASAGRAGRADAGSETVPAEGAPASNGTFEPFRRDPETLARPWAIPGTKGLEHRIGGIEKADVTGTISYDPDNHDRMVRLRQAKIDGIATDIAPLRVDDPDGTARVLVLGWGSTFGSIAAAARAVRSSGQPVATAHLRHLNPFPANLGETLHRYDKVLVPEINLGQLALLLRGKYLADVISYNRVRGLPFGSSELADVIKEVISEELQV